MNTDSTILSCPTIFHWWPLKMTFGWPSCQTKSQSLFCTLQIPSIILGVLVCTIEVSWILESANWKSYQPIIISLLRADTCNMQQNNTSILLSPFANVFHIPLKSRFLTCQIVRTYIQACFNCWLSRMHFYLTFLTAWVYPSWIHVADISVSCGMKLSLEIYYGVSPKERHTFIFNGLSAISILSRSIITP